MAHKMLWTNDGYNGEKGSQYFGKLVDLEFDNSEGEGVIRFLRVSGDAEAASLEALAAVENLAPRYLTVSKDFHLYLDVPEGAPTAVLDLVPALQAHLEMQLPDETLTKSKKLPWWGICTETCDCWFCFYPRSFRREKTVRYVSTDILGPVLAEHPAALELLLSVIPKDIAKVLKAAVQKKKI